MLKNFRLQVLYFLILLNLTCPLRAKPSSPEITIHKLKDLHLTTSIAESGKAQAVIIVPESGAYEVQASLIQRAIKEKSGILIPVLKKAADPQSALRTTNVIALGNMTTNPFIYRLYCQWYTLLDQKYPGKGGYVVRSLHDPYGTGKNIIEIGGSDEKGVTKAAERFCEILPAGKDIITGRLMEIKLGDGLVPPDVKPDGTGLDKVRTWMGQDWGSKNVDTGFGWNPISLAGILYYMTGDEKYITCFKNLVKPDTNNIPAVIREWYSFVNMKRPLVEQVEEYTDHQVDFVWDLIEDSPSLSDEDRLYVTNELLAHQFFRDPDNNFTSMSPGRHPGFALLGIYSGSRYFAKYYPAPVWEQRLNNVRKSYNDFIGNPSFGNDNTFYWASFVQYIFEYFIIDGYDDFVKSGTAKTYMDALLLLRNGEKKGDYYDGITPYQLNLGAWSTGDPSYFWLLKELDYNDKTFRVGRSFWPSEKISALAPDISGKFITFPLKASNLPEGEGFEIASYRSGLDDKAAYFQLDGHNGSGRSSYHLNSISKLRMQGGKYLLDGINNDIDITCNGMSDSIVPQAAAMKKSFTGSRIAYIRSDVPDMTNSSWQRNILYLEGAGLIVIDRTISRKTSDFEIECSWTLPKNHSTISFNPDFIRSSEGAVISFANQGNIVQDRGNIVKNQFSLRLPEGDHYDIGNLICFSESVPSQRMIKTGKNNFMVTGGNNDIFICLDDFENSYIKISADFALVSSERLFFSGLKTFSTGAGSISSDIPVELLWDLKKKKIELSAQDAGSLTIENESEKYIISFGPGKNSYEKMEPGNSSAERIMAAIKQARGLKYSDPLAVTIIDRDNENWRSDWQVKRNGDASNLDFSASGGLWAAWDCDSTYRIANVSPDGKILAEKAGKGKILSFTAAKTAKQSGSFEILAGFMDDTVGAFSSSASPVWKIKAEPDPSFRIGDKYIAPWFSDPKVASGVYDIMAGDLWGNGREEIVLGRPVTLEFRSLDGRLISRIPTQWGTNTTLSLLKHPSGNDSLNVVLAGKFITGYPGQSAVNINHENVNDNLFNGAKKGWTFINGWGQQGVSQSVVADLDNDGNPEFITTITGHWNELRVWPGKLSGIENFRGTANKNGVTVMSGGTANSVPAARNEAPLWTRYFGSNTEGTWIIQGVLQRDPVEKMKDRFMKSLLVADINGDGLREVIVGIKNGWLHVFDYKGKLLWQKKFEAGIRCLEAVKGEKGRLTAGLANGKIYLLDDSGNVLQAGRLDSSVEKIKSSGPDIYAGTLKGTIAKFRVK